MELNYTGADIPVYQNFSKYTEVDSAADLTVIERVVTWNTMQRDAISWVVYDFGADYFGNFTCDFTLDFSDIEAGDISNRHIMGLCSFSNTVGTFADNIGGDMLIILPRQIGSTDNWYQYNIYQFTGGVLDFSIADTTNYDMTRHYCTLERSGTTITLRIYTDEARTVLIDTLTDTGNNQKYRYFHVMTSYDSVEDGTDHSSGLVSDVSFEKVVGGYETEGYFLTEDYLNYTTGQGLALLTNASIPVGTSIKVQFSNDNATWVDNEGNVGSTPVLDGFYAIDLRDLNYTDSFKRYNLTTGDPSITPRLFQSRLITTEGQPVSKVNGACEFHIFNASSINVIVGTLNDGNLASTYFIDNDWYNVSEDNAIPGLDVRFNFSDVEGNVSCGCIEVFQTYTGHSNHDVEIQVWNFTSNSWVLLGSFLYNVTADWVCVGLGHDADHYFSGGELWARFYHAGQGHVAHEIQVDRIDLRVVYGEECEACISVAEANFFWIFIAIVLSIITALLVWMKYGDSNN